MVTMQTVKRAASDESTGDESERIGCADSNDCLSPLLRMRSTSPKHQHARACEYGDRPGTSRRHETRRRAAWIRGETVNKSRRENQGQPAKATADIGSLSSITADGNTIK